MAWAGPNLALVRFMVSTKTHSVKTGLARPVSDLIAKWYHAKVLFRVHLSIALNINAVDLRAADRIAVKFD